ncbi:bifunctional glycosyltransferase family 2/GtrA family protein [Conexibacter woesei]|uniref:bifunctional glycosyltransferase family 2/GtrA family protein n=1 Tax=Conexibacter woesei TaxID=191495 RepID=UPI000684CAEB|nr:bifunctional glycosyltransferase family 2/GtrA family protein [Conexibacter woesei]
MPSTRPRFPAPAVRPDVEVVVPVYNEQLALEPSIRRLHAFLSDGFPFTWSITIADNASTDGTPFIAADLARELPEVRHLRLERKGRGLALREAWSHSGARIVSYMDVDLSTDLRALLPLVAPLLSGHSDVAIGSRLARGAHVTRGPKRELISRSYNKILKASLRVNFTDAQCGFKAVTSEAAALLLPQIRDDGWFFDTELLVLAQRGGLRTHEVPVDWVDDPDSRVDIVRTAVDDLRGVARLAFATPVARFAAVGVASTVAYALLFILMREGGIGAGVANAVALALTAVANTAANRRLTFGVLGREGLVKQHAAGAAVFFLTLGLTDGALGVLHGVAPGASRGVELAVLVGASLVATITRYVALRTWVFAGARRGAVARRSAAGDGAAPAESASPVAFAETRS